MKMRLISYAALCAVMLSAGNIGAENIQGKVERLVSSVDQSSKIMAEIDAQSLANQTILDGKLDQAIAASDSPDERAALASHDPLLMNRVSTLHKAIMGNNEGKKTLHGQKIYELTQKGETLLAEYSKLVAEAIKNKGFFITDSSFQLSLEKDRVRRSIIKLIAELRALGEAGYAEAFEKEFKAREKLEPKIQPEKVE